MTTDPRSMTASRDRSGWPTLTHRPTHARPTSLPNLRLAAIPALARYVRTLERLDCVAELDDVLVQLDRLDAERVLLAARLLELGASTRYVAEAARLAHSVVARIRGDLDAQGGAL